MECIRHWLIVLFSVILLGNAFAQQRVNYLDQGRIALSEGHFAAAIEKLNIAIQQRADQYDAYFLRGYAKLRLDDYIGAEADFSRAIDLNPFWAQLFTFRGNARDKLSNYQGAFSDYQRALKLDSTDGSIYANRALTLLYLQQFQASIADCDQALKLNFKTENIYVIRGEALAGLKREREAIADYDIALSINRFSSYAHVQRGVAYMALKSYDTATVDLHKALKLDSTNSFAYYQLAVLETERGNDSLAMNYINTVIRLTPFNTSAIYCRANLYEKRKQYADAVSDLSNIIAIAPSNFLAYHQRAYLYSIAHQYKLALADFDKAIELAPEYADAYLNRAIVKENLQDIAGARSDRKMAKSIAERNKQLSDTVKFAESIKIMKMMSEGSDFSSNSETKEALQYRQVAVQFRLPYLFLPLSIKRGKVVAYSTALKSKHHHDVVRLYNLTDTIPVEVITKALQLLESMSSLTSSQYLDKAALQIQLHHFNDATESINNSLQGDSTNPVTFFESGNLKLQLVRFLKSINPDAKYDNAIAEGLRDYTIALSLDPSFYIAFYNRGILKSEANDFKGALGDFTTALQIKADCSDAYYNRGLLYILFKENLPGCSDLSRAGELGIQDAYSLLKRYCN